MSRTDRGRVGPYDPIRVIEAWGAGFCIGSALDCIWRAARSDSDEALHQAAWYLDRVDAACRSGRRSEPSSSPIPVHASMVPSRVAREWGLSASMAVVLEHIFLYLASVTFTTGNASATHLTLAASAIRKATVRDPACC